MKNDHLRGTGVALVTPFAADGSVEFGALEKLIHHCINGGVDYVVSLGTTGESVALTTAEKHKVLEFTVKAVSGKVPVVAGFGGNSTQTVIDEMKKFHFDGIAAILSVSPYYNKPSQEGIFQHYTAISEAAPRPVIIYNVPGRTSSNIKAETTLRIASELKNVIGIKEASGDLAQCMQLVKNKPENFLLISGDDNLTLPLLALGFEGVISVSGQAFPQMFSAMVRSAMQGDVVSARALHYPLVDVTDMLFAEGNPAGIKEVLSLLGVCSNRLRLPLTNVSASLSQRMKAEIEERKLK